jgi:hypothetical protein
MNNPAAQGDDVRRAPMIAFTDEQIAGKRQQSILQSARKPLRLNTPIL